MMRRRIMLAFLCLAVSGCGGEDDKGDKGDKGDVTRKIETVREAAVEGLFYPGDKDELSKLLDDLLADAGAGSPTNLRALICPHAGYAFSGKTAAIAYKQAAGGDFGTVVVLAPTHCASFQGASVPPVDAYRTPLGLVPLSPKADELAKVAPFVSKPACNVARPGWSSKSSKEGPVYLGDDTPHTWEHSLEVQLPFLQKVLKDFTLVPAVLGQVDAKAAAKALDAFVTDDTLVIASSDLSHFLPYDQAQKLDKATISAILRLDTEALTGTEACGYAPVRTLLHLARSRRWQARLLDYRNSGDTSGNMSSVVGYAAVAFYAGEPPKLSTDPAAATREGPAYSAEQRRDLLALARETLTRVVEGGSAPVAADRNVPWSLNRPRGCFVTLTKQGQLRGCIGNIFPREGLYDAVVQMTRGAALADGRFLPVRKHELKDIEIEISVLTVPRPLKFNSPEDLLAKLRPNIDGVVLRVGGRQSTYLPQVWQQMSDKTEFLSSLARKAGLSPSAWRQKGVAILTYQAEAFHEKPVPLDIGPVIRDRAPVSHD